MAKRIPKHFQKAKPPATRLVQARIPITLVKNLKPFMKEYKLTWTKIVSGALQTLSDKVSKGKK